MNASRAMDTVATAAAAAAAAAAAKASALSFGVPAGAPPVVFAVGYDVAFLGLERLHPFDSRKWGRVAERLAAAGLLAPPPSPRAPVEPREPTRADLLIVHTERYLDSLGRSAEVARITELAPLALLPNALLQRHLLRALRLQTGGTVLACQLALERGWALNIGGGFHHCSSNAGGGFCAYADISLAVRFALDRFGVSRVMIIDLDAHQGNGHERDFAGNDHVYILDVYNGDIYPQDVAAKKGIRKEVILQSGTNDDAYLQLLSKNLAEAGEEFSPQLILYNAGTDLLEGDPLGRLSVTADGVIGRDEMVFQFARRMSCPIMMVTSGGYQKNNADVIAKSIISLAEKKLISLESQS
eukprot:SM000122S25756  [mRNA]  locus=s122:176840:180181:+ [translate_table: standard]